MGCPIGYQPGFVDQNGTKFVVCNPCNDDLCPSDIFGIVLVSIMGSIFLCYLIVLIRECSRPINPPWPQC